MEEQLKQIEQDCMKQLEEVHTLQALQDLRVTFLGKKGVVTSLLKGLGKMDPEERPKAGAMVNSLRQQLEEEFQKRQTAFEEQALQAQLEEEKIDISMPGRHVSLGHFHPLTKVNQLIEEFFSHMGYSIEEGPEIESDYYNFECLNLPAEHPARDMQDSFYLTNSYLLRTHTSPVQARTMQGHEPNTPIRMIAPGKVYRWDYDATHSPVFHQVEGLYIDEQVNFAELKGTLVAFLKYIFGEDTKVRFRTSFFPFTEPSAEVDISCVICGGDGCRVCSHTGWLEILGCGMVHPKVLEINGYDPKKMQGFAFGMGVERIAMLLYGISDLRLFYENDVRFLNQF